MSRGAFLSAGLLVCGLSTPVLAVTGQPYDYPPPYTTGNPFAHSGYHHYAYRHRHYVTSPYHRHSGLEPYPYYNPER